MISKTTNHSTLLAIVLILLAAASRLLPHPPNFTAIGALAFFSGTQIRDRKLTFLLPLAAMFLSDLYIGLHAGVLPVYACVAFSVYLGLRISDQPSFWGSLFSVLAGSVVFFLVTNLPVFYPGLYPNTLGGLFESYTAALPFFRNQLLGDFIYTSLLFGAFSLLKNNVFNLTD